MQTQANSSPISIRLPAELKARVQGAAAMRQRSAMLCGGAGEVTDLY